MDESVRMRNFSHVSHEKNASNSLQQRDFRFSFSDFSGY